MNARQAKGRGLILRIGELIDQLGSYDDNTEVKWGQGEPIDIIELDDGVVYLDKEA